MTGQAREKKDREMTAPAAGVQCAPSGIRTLAAVIAQCIREEPDLCPLRVGSELGEDEGDPLEWMTLPKGRPR